MLKRPKTLNHHHHHPFSFVGSRAMLVSRGTSWLMQLQDVRPVHPSLVAFPFRHGTSAPRSRRSWNPSGRRSGKLNRASSGISSLSSNLGGQAYGGIGRRRSCSAGCASDIHTQHMAISSVARKSRSARGAVCHSLWLMFFCLARMSAEVELAISVASLPTPRFVTS